MGRTVLPFCCPRPARVLRGVLRRGWGFAAPLAVTLVAACASTSPSPEGVCGHERLGWSDICAIGEGYGTPYTGRITRWERDHITFTTTDGTVVDYDPIEVDRDIWDWLPDLGQAGEVTMVDQGGECAFEAHQAGKYLYVYRGTPPDEEPLLLIVTATEWSSLEIGRWGYELGRSNCPSRDVEQYCVDTIDNHPVTFQVDGESTTLYQGQEASLGGSRMVLFTAETWNHEDSEECTEWGQTFDLLSLAFAAESLD